jgi:hypothetical protein
MKPNITQPNHTNAWLFRFLLLVAILMGVCLQSKAQYEGTIDKNGISPSGAVLVNYTFEKIHKWVGYPYHADETATGIESYVTSLEPFHETSSGAVSTGQLAFKENIGNNGALVMQPSCGDDMRYLQFIVSGASLKDYGHFKLYLMAQGHPHAATALTLQYSINGVEYFDGGVFTLLKHTHFFENVYDISNAGILNTYNLNMLYLRVYAAGSHDGKDCGAYRIEFDNVQLYAETDTETPLILNCAPPLSVQAGVENCTFPIPDFTTSMVVTDNAPLEELVVTQAPAAGTLVGIGVYPITLYVADKQGNQASCATTFSVHGFIYAGDDIYYMPVNATGFAGNALENDYMHCLPVKPDMVTISIVFVSFDADLSLNLTSGHLMVHTAVPPGTYTIVYRIHEKDGDPDMYADATITLYVDDPLPTRSIKLSATKNGNDVILHWTASIDENASHFMVERSTNGVSFAQLSSGGEIAISDKGIASQRYSITDRNVTGDIWYYRTILYEIDGKTKVSNTVTVKMNHASGLNVYPNPVVLQMVITFPEAGVYELALMTSNGQIVNLQKAIGISSEARTITLPVSQFAPGMYILRAVNTQTRMIFTTRLMVHRN